MDFLSSAALPDAAAVPRYIGLEGDLLDAVVLGKRLPRGTRTKVRAWGAIALTTAE